MDEKPSEPSLLEYARFYGIAADSKAVHPFEYLDNTCKTTHQHIPQLPSAFVDTCLSEAHSLVENSVRRERLNANKEDAQFLSKIFRLGSTKIETDWESCLYSHYSSAPRLDIPLLKRDNDAGFDVASFKKERRFLLDLDHADLSPIVTESQDLEDLGFLDDIFWEAGRVARRIQKEKLDCSRDSLLLIQNVKRYGDLGAKDDVERYFQSLLESSYQPRSSSLEPHFLHPLNLGDASYKSPIPTTTAHMLPTPASSDVIERYGSVPEPSHICRRPLNTDMSQGHQRNSDDATFQQNTTWTEDSGDSLFQNESPEPSWKGKDAAGVGHTDVFSISSAERCEEQTRGVKKGQVQQGEYLLEGCIISVAPPQDVNIVTSHDSVQGSIRSENDRSDEIIKLSSHQCQLQPPKTHSKETLVSKIDDRTRYQVSSRTSGEQCQLKLEKRIFTHKQQHSRERQSSLETQSHPVPKIGTDENIGSLPTSTLPDRNSDNGERIQKQSPEVALNASVYAEAEEALCVEDSPVKVSTPAKVPCPPTPQPKKRNRDKTKTTPKKKKKKCKSDVQAKTATSQFGESQNALSKASASAPLGSLSRFMETRGIAVKPRITERSSYFIDTEPKPEDNVEEHTTVPATDNAETEVDHEDTADKETYAHALDIDTTLIPQNSASKTQKPLALFLSASLLKSHIQLIRTLEGMLDAPTLIYRDYNSCHRPHGMQSPIQIKKRPPTTKPPEAVLEADIIISPAIGIILTTSQALTQLYLPGHRPSCPLISALKEINSPLRERIFRVSSRYEQLYILVCQPVDTGKDKDPRNEWSSLQRKPTSKQYKSPTIDKRTLSSIASLNAFCASLTATRRLQGHERGREFGSHSQLSPTVTPVLIPAIPGIMVDWIFALADKHTFKLSHNDDDEGYFQQEETHWEVFLREAGLNPFAAQTVLRVLGNQDTPIGEELPIAMHHRHGIDDDYYRDGSNGWNERIVEDVPALSKFVEMSSEERRCLFEGLIGGSVLRRVEAVIDRDWQCDWALDFDTYRLGSLNAISIDL